MPRRFRISENAVDSQFVLGKARWGERRRDGGRRGGEAEWEQSRYDAERQVNRQEGGGIERKGDMFREVAKAKGTASG